MRAATFSLKKIAEAQNKAIIFPEARHVFFLHSCCKSNCLLFSLFPSLIVPQTIFLINIKAQLALKHFLPSS